MNTSCLNYWKKRVCWWYTARASEPIRWRDIFEWCIWPIGMRWQTFSSRSKVFSRDIRQAGPPLQFRLARALVRPLNGAFRKLLKFLRRRRQSLIDISNDIRDRFNADRNAYQPV